MIIIYNIQQIFQNEKHRLPSTAHSLRPDCSTINLAETSVQAENWLFHPVGITFKFDVKKVTGFSDNLSETLDEHHKHQSDRYKTKRFKTCQVL